MKQNLNKLIKFGILFFGISFLILACQKDDSIIEINNGSTKKQKTANFQLVPNSQLNKSKSFKNALSKLSTNSKEKSNNENARIIYSDIYNLSIDTDYSLVNTFDKYKTYTFKIYRDNPDHSVLENLVIDLNTISGETTQLIFSYPIIGNSYDIDNVTIQQIHDANLTYARFSSDVYL